MIRIARWEIALALVAMLGIGFLVGTANAGDRNRWTHYRDPAGNALVVKSRCIAAEDSAAHLRLVDYSAGRIVYGCERRGY